MSATPISDRPPPRFQFRLGTVLIATVVIGIACAALAMPTPFWAGTLLCLALLSLLACVLLAIYRTNETRAFAVGFLVFAVGYLSCVIVLDHGLRKFEWQTAMPTSRIAYRIFVATARRRPVAVQSGNFGPPGSFGGMGGMTSTTAPAVTTRTMQVPVHNGEDFIEITHSVLALLLGFVGGIFAHFLFVTRRDDDSHRIAREDVEARRSREAS